MSWLVSAITNVVLVVGFVSWLLWVFVQILALKRGRELSTQPEFKISYNLTAHRRLAFFSLKLYLANAVLGAIAHSLVRGNIGGTHGATFWIHLPAAIILLGAMAVMRFWLDGKTSPRAHRWLALIVLLSFPVVAYTSFILWCSLWQA